MAASSKGKLFVVATPIGNLDDIGRRALAALRNADLVLCEDTRVSWRLLDRYGVTSRLSSLHEHNERRRTARIVRQLREGLVMALISDAGTPTVSDPGRKVVAAAHEAGVEVVSVPGPNAAVAALAGSGADADRFVFEGFLPSRRPARLARLESLKNEARTMVFYEAPHRIAAMLEDLAAIFGTGRRVCLAKELTKANERFVCGSPEQVHRWLEGDAKRRKGEFVVVVSGAADEQPEDGKLDCSPIELLEALLEHLPARVAAGLVAKLGGGRRNQLYQAALEKSGKR